MFATADLNKDGFVDLNEFVAMRRRTQERQRRLEDKQARKAGKGSGRRRKDGNPRDDAEAAPEKASWAVKVQSIQEAEEAVDRQARAAQASELARRFAMDDALHELPADELQILSDEILSGAVGARGLDVEACRASLGMLAMRVGKMFAPTEIDAFVDELVRAQGDGGCITPAQLVAGLEQKGAGR